LEVGVELAGLLITSRNPAMCAANNPIDYERLEREVPAAFPWVALVKLVAAVVAVPVIICGFWLLMLICYWFKYGRWPGWNTSIGG
jgi:hypothetical protein